MSGFDFEFHNLFPSVPIMVLNTISSLPHRYLILIDQIQICYSALDCGPLGAFKIQTWILSTLKTMFCGDLLIETTDQSAIFTL